MALRFNAPYFEWIDGTGTPLAGGKLYFYASGTSTPLATYSDAALTTPNANPVIANASGYWGAIFLQALDYKVLLKDANDVQIWSADPVSGSSGSGQSNNVRTITTNTTITSNDGTLICNSASAITATLPSAASVTGQTFTFVQTNTGNVTLVGTINGVANYIIPGALQYQAISVRSDGASYVIV